MAESTRETAATTRRPEQGGTAGPVRQPKQDRGKRLKRALTDYSFVIPAGLFLFAFMVFPVLFNIQLSFRNVTASTLLSGDAPFVGLENYRAIFSDPVFRETAANTLIFAGASLVFQVSIGLALAIFYNQKLRALRAMRALYLIAWTIPIVVTGAVFRWLLDGEYGVVNWALRGVGIIDGPVYWLTDPGLALPAVIFINVWLGIPFNMILILAGLQGIPDELYDAASVDGASWWAKIRYITLPLLRPALLAVGLLGMIYTFKAFDIIWVATSGGPVHATEVMSTLAYKLVFGQFVFGEGAAVLNVLFVFLFVAALVYLWATRKEEASR